MKRPAPALPLLLFASLAASLTGCVTHEYIVGTASYTSTPASATSTGAHPTAALVCEAAPLHVYYVEIAQGCPLRLGSLATRHDRGAISVTPLGTCVLPSPEGDMPIDVASASGRFDLGQLELTIGGVNRADGRYVTYAFAGPRPGEDDAGDACEGVIARHQDDIARVRRGG